MMLDDESILTLRFWRSSDIGPKRFWQAHNQHGSITKAYGHIALADERTIRDEITQTHNIGAEFVFFKDFPPLLKAIPDAPPVLIVKGRVSLWHQSCIAIVGSRNVSYAGRTMAKRLAEDLGKAGHITVSGLARGVDGAVHEASCDTGTIAVVAGGIDIIYPQEHTKLYERVGEQGLIITEMGIGTMPQPRLFPRRNRLIAGLSRALIVVEAGKPSGSLITADYALKYGRDVMAVPGTPVDERSKGSNALLRDGAVLVESAEDCLAAIMPNFVYTPSTPYLLKEENDDPVSILSALSAVPVTLDELIALHPEMSPQSILRYLGELMLQGHVLDVGNRYVKVAG